MRQFALPPDSTNAGGPPARLDAQAIIQGLNPAQQEAAGTVDGPVLIVAGPGSGKTRTLTHRIAYLLAEGKAKPWQILSLTFTNKAAKEMRERVTGLVGAERAKGMWLGTFHSIFSRVLRYDADKIGFTSDFTIYDSDDTERVLRAQMKRFNIDTKQYSPRAVRSLISSAKNQQVSPEEYGRFVAGPAQEAAAQVYGPYQEILRKSNAMDFDDLLIWPLRLFEQHPDVLEKYQNKWRYLHIDEYQDTNHTQYLLAKQLAARHKNICVVGDDAQSIYAFRGADITNILSFQRDYPEATTVRLEQNYRSTRKILQLADSIIKQNQDQLDKSLWTENREGDDVVMMEALSEKDEAQKVERTIRDLHVRAGYTYREFAVLYRTNAQSRSFEDALRRGGIPYRLVGGQSFYQRKEIKDVLAYLRLAVNPNDTASLRRVINYPTRGIGDKTVQQLLDFARFQGVTLWQAIERIEEVGLSARATNAVEKFRFLVAKYAAKSTSTPPDDLTREYVKEMGILDDLRKDLTMENQQRWENVQELISAIAEFTSNAEGTDEPASLSTFLQDISLLTDADSEDRDTNVVTLMTLHASKGLEFSVVFVVGMEEGLFPLSKAAQDPKDLEEERRLFYVGATRAEARLYLSYARSRFRYGKQESGIRSRFLDEIDPSVVRTEAGGGLRQQTGRFTQKGVGGATGYDGMDNNYWRKNLRDGTTGPAKKKKRTSTRKTTTPIAQGRHIEYDAGVVPSEAGGGSQIVPGIRVRHHQFGEGKVIAVEGRGDRAKATVFFTDAGQKKLVLKFARLRRIG